MSYRSGSVGHTEKCRLSPRGRRAVAEFTGGPAKMIISERPLDGRRVKAVRYQLGSIPWRFYARCYGEKGLEYIGPILTDLGTRSGQILHRCSNIVVR